MSDLELRELERAASTGDVAATWKLVHALDRLGDKRRRFAELCKLARLGDREAARSVREAVPCPEVGTTSFPGRGVREPVVVRRHPMKEEVHVLATAETVFLADSKRVVRVPWESIGGSFEPVAAPRPGLPHLVGDDLLLLDEAQLVLKETNGSVRGSVPVPGGSRSALVRACGDRCVVWRWSERRRIVDVYDVGEGAIRRLWSTFPPVTTTVRMTLDAVLVTAGETSSAYEVDTGKLRWTAPGYVVAADERNVLMRRPDGLVELLDATTGLVAWKATVSERADLLLGESIVVITETKSITAHDRATGTVLWGAHSRFDSVALTDDTVYVEFQKKALVLDGLDARTGLRVLRVVAPEGQRNGRIAAIARDRILFATTSELLEILRA